MARILPFIKSEDVFDDELTRRMGEAFDAACAAVENQPSVVKEVIACRIIEAAKKGERNPDSLRRAGMMGLESYGKASQGVTDNLDAP
jgi:hypothetical protein